MKENDFTLILMDVQMPDLNGFETATLIYERDKLKRIPVIFITANDHGDENVFKGYQMGGVDYIYKPINPELLRAKVAVFVALYTQNHKLIVQEQKMAAANKQLEKEIQDKIRSEEQIKQLNKQLLDNITRLKETNGELERFAYVASHDLQEPLRKIMVFSEHLSSRYGAILKEEGSDFVERIQKSAERMRVLIKNILNFSKSQVKSDAFERTDIRQLVDGVLSDLEMSIQQKQATFHVGTLPVLRVIPAQFRQLFQNLIINALKFSQESFPPDIYISSEVDPNDDRYCNICIKDNGIGFEQKYADDIFILFTRLNTYDKFEGTGIGLAVCKKIVEQHGGFISARSDVNKGATFIISLPIGEKLEPARQLIST